MDIIKIYLIVFPIFLICIIPILFYLDKLSKLIKTELHNLHTQSTADERFDERQLTSYELERLEREEEFDKRINRLKDELAMQQDVIRHGIPAEELHPLVHNLPHNTVQTKYDVLPDVEIAE